MISGYVDDSIYHSDFLYLAGVTWNLLSVYYEEEVQPNFHVGSES